MKRFLCILMAIMLFSGLVGCGSANSYPDGEPQITTEKQMFIGAFCSPYPTDAAYKVVAECGINNMVIFATGSASSDGMPAVSENSPAFYKDPFDYGQKYGVNIIPNTANAPWTKFKGNKYNQSWKKYPNYGGINVFDEPSANDFADLKKYLTEYKQEASGYPYFINLFPNYANAKQLGTSTYDDYVSMFTDELLMNMDEGNRYMVCDIYPLLRSNQIYTGWLSNLEILRHYADKADADLYIYIQSIGFSSRRQPSSVADIRFQAYVSMAYGATGIYYFTYLTPYWDSMYIANHGLVNAKGMDGETTEVYDYAKEVNTELLKLDDVYLDFQWKKMIASIGTSNLTGENANFASCEKMEKSYGILDSVESTQDTIVGCFENKDGYQGFMAVNFTDPNLKKQDDVTLHFNSSIKKVKIYVGGEEQEVGIENGVLTVDLSAGEGKFIVPYKG